MRELSPAMSRLSAVGLLAVLLMFLLLYFILPLWHYYVDATEDLSLKRRQLAQFHYLLGNEERIDEELALMEDANTGDMFLAGSKPAIASANLREFVAEAVRESGGELISSQEYEAQPIASTVAVGLQLMVRGEVQNLVELLHAIETARPVIFIDQLDLSNSSKRSSSSRDIRRAKSKGNPSSLEIRLNIVGYLVHEEELESGSAK